MRRAGGEPSAHAARGEHAVQRGQIAHALELLRAALLDREQSRDQTLRRGGDEHGVGLGDRLHPGRDVGCVAEDIGCIAAALADNDRAGMHTDAHAQGHAVLCGDRGVQLVHGIDDRQPGAHGPFGVVLMRLRDAEEAHQTVAQVLVDMAAKSFDCIRGGALICGRDLAPILGIEAGCNLGRADEVAEQYGELAALAVGD